MIADFQTVVVLCYKLGNQTSELSARTKIGPMYSTAFSYKKQIYIYCFNKLIIYINFEKSDGFYNSRKKSYFV